MKIRISVSDENFDRVRAYLEEHLVELGDDAEFIITETEKLELIKSSQEEKAPEDAFLIAYDKDHDRIRLLSDEIIFIEAFGKDIELHTTDGTYLSRDRMYQLEEKLNPKEFIRISKSVIISRKHVKKIRPSLSMKFILTMSDGTLVDVTRSYYSSFKEFFHI